jgi:hypothetical protein
MLRDFLKLCLLFIGMDSNSKIFLKDPRYVFLKDPRLFLRLL